MKNRYTWPRVVGITVTVAVLAIVGHTLQIAGLNLSAHKVEHATQQGQARLQARVGKTYWVQPNSASTYQFVRFGNANTQESIMQGSVVDDTEQFTVMQLVVRPDSDSGTYQVRFTDGSLKGSHAWMDASAFDMHLEVPGSGVKKSAEIFDQVPAMPTSRLHEVGDADVKPVLGPDPEKGPSPLDPVFGMTASQVTASNWGKPDNVVVVQTPTGVVDIWSYSHGNFLAFRNGRLEEVLNTARGIVG